MPRVFTEGFRVFFLAGPLYAVLAGLAWEGWLGLHAVNAVFTGIPFRAAPHLWHGHEMIFGYATAILAGFFLTALPGWTGTKPSGPAFITLLAGLWLAGRLAVWFSATLDPILVAVIDLAFLPVLLARLAASLLRRPKPANLIFAFLLAGIIAGNVFVHLEWTGVIEDGAASGLRLGLCAICAMITILGGRVTPAFTRNAMARAGDPGRPPASLPALDIVTIAGAILFGALYAFAAPSAAVAACGIAVGLAQFARIALWRPDWALRQPILWSMHLGMAMLSLGYLALGLAAAGIGIADTAALHVLGIGAVGGMTLAIMSRAGLGHTGRPLTVAPAMAWAYASIAAAGLLRFAGPELFPALYFEAVLLAGAFWILGFVLFLAVYWPILTGPPEGAA